TAQVFGPDRERNAIFQRLVIREEDVRSLAHRILEQKLPALVREGALPPQMSESLGMRTVLIVPLVCRDSVLGIMTLDHTRGLRLFTSKEINVVMGVAQQTAIAIENFRLKSEAAKARETLRVASEILSDGLITLTAAHRIVSLDPTAEALLQWPTAEVSGKGFSQAFTITNREGTRLPDIAQGADLVLRVAEEALRPLRAQALQPDLEDGPPPHVRRAVEPTVRRRRLLREDEELRARGTTDRREERCDPIDDALRDLPVPVKDDEGLQA